MPVTMRYPGMDVTEYGSRPAAPTSPDFPQPAPRSYGQTTSYPGMDVTEFGTHPQAPVQPSAPQPATPRSYGQTTRYPGMDVTEFGTRPQAPASTFNPPTLTDVHTPAPAGVPPAAPMGGNPNIGAAASEVAPAANASRAYQAGQTAGQTVGRAASTVRGAMPSLPAVGSALGRVAGVGGVGVGAYEAASGLRDGDYGKAGLGAADAAASAGLLTGVGTVPAALYMTGRAAAGAGGALYDSMSDKAKNFIGERLNNAARYVGLGTDDSALKSIQDAEATGMRNPATGNDPAMLAAQRGAPATVNPTDTRLASGAQTAPTSIPGSPVAGADGVRKIVGADGKVTYTNDPNGAGQPGYGVSTIGGGAEGMQRNLRAADIYSSMAHSGDVPAGQAMTVLGGGGVDLRDPSYLAARNAGVGGTGGRAGRAQQGIDVQRRGQDLNYGATLRGQDVTARGQDINAGVTTRGQDINAGVTTRGQDLTHEATMFGHNVSALGNRARLAYDMYKDGRDFGLRSQEADQKMTEQSQASNQKMLESMFRTQQVGKDGTTSDVPDTGKIAQYTQAVQTTLPSMIKEARTNAASVAQTNPQLAKALSAKADDLEKRGPGALTPDDHAQIKQLFDTRDRMEQARGPMPGSGTFKRSDNLLDYRQLPGDAGVRQRLIGGNRIVTPAGEVSVNDLKFDQLANPVMPDWFKVGNNNLTRGLRTN